MKRKIYSMMKDVNNCISNKVGHVVILTNFIETSVSFDVSQHKDKIIEMLERTLKRIKSEGKEEF